MKKINRKFKIAIAAIGWIGLVAGSITTGITYKNYNETQKITDFYNQYTALNSIGYGSTDNYIKLYNQSTDKKQFINNDYSTSMNNFVNDIKALPNGNFTDGLISDIKAYSNTFTQMTNDVNSLSYVNCDTSGLIAGSVVLSVFGVIGIGITGKLIYEKKMYSM